MLVATSIVSTRMESMPATVIRCNTMFHGQKVVGRLVMNAKMIRSSMHVVIMNRIGIMNGVHDRTLCTVEMASVNGPNALKLGTCVGRCKKTRSHTNAKRAVGMYASIDANALFFFVWFSPMMTDTHNVSAEPSRIAFCTISPDTEITTS